MPSEDVPAGAGPHQAETGACRGQSRAAIAGLLLLAAALAACSCGDSRESPEKGDVTLVMGGVTVNLELALTDATRARGLMYRKELAENSGMFFVYEEPQFLSFWMKNTWIPLSIAFLRDDGTIINIEKMRPHLSTVSYKSEELSRYALEMNAGWFERHDLAPGDRIDINPVLPVIKERMPGGDKEDG
jgi:uncharacterized membrane protein (UPF0127 family)